MAMLKKWVAPERLVSESLVVTHVFVLGIVSHPKRTCRFSRSAALSSCLTVSMCLSFRGLESCSLREWTEEVATSGNGEVEGGRACPTMSKPPPYPISPTLWSLKKLVTCLKDSFTVLN